jgi:hypothetical protein
LVAGVGSWDWLPTISAAAGSGLVTLLTRLYFEFTDKPDRIERYVKEDQEYRAELAAKLRGGRIGTIYRNFLTRGLDWLDRHWGEASSARSLGVCIIIALCYSYAAFFIAWGVGGPGNIGGLRLLGEATQPGRALLALWLVAAPVLGFVFGRWVGRQERRWKARLRRRLRWRRRRFEASYRAVLAVVFVIVVLALVRIGPEIAVGAGFAALFAVGPSAGIAAAWRSRQFFWAGILATGAGAGAFAVAGAGGVAVAVAVAGAFEVSRVFAVAGALAGSVALAGAVALAGTGAVGGAVAVAVAVAAAVGGAFTTGGLVAVVGAVAGAAAIGAATALRRHQGAFAGGIGALLGFGLTGGVVGTSRGLADELVVPLIVFFLVLPVVNGIWDWLSWWITRALGRHLLTSFGAARGLGPRMAAVIGHGTLDLVLAVALLAAMAFFLAFGFESYNRIAMLQQGAEHPAFVLAPFLANAADHPWSGGLWLTVTLLSTLLPTALHMVALLASPIALVTLPSEKRLALATDLEGYDRQPERHASIQRRAGRYVARERHAALALAAGLFILLTAGLFELINLLLGHLGEGQTIAHLVLDVARWGIEAAHALV